MNWNDDFMKGISLQLETLKLPRIELPSFDHPMRDLIAQMESVNSPINRLLAEMPRSALPTHFVSVPEFPPEILANLDRTAKMIAEANAPMVRLLETFGRAHGLGLANLDLPFPRIAAASFRDAIPHLGLFERIAASIPDLSSVFASVSALTRDLSAACRIEMPIGVLSSGADFSALKWLDDDSSCGGEALLLPSLDGEDSSRRTVEVRCEPQCLKCGGGLFAREVERFLTGDVLRIQVGVLPFCQACARKLVDDPEYKAEFLRELVDAPLVLIEGKGEGHGPPSGRLQLVKRQSDEETDD